MRSVLHGIDSISEWTGRIVHWLVVVLVIVMTYEVIMRHFFNSPNIWAYELPVMLSASFCVMGWAYAHRHGLHLRIEAFYSLIPRRGQAIINLIGDLFLFCPFVFVFAIFSVSNAQRAWFTGEVMSDSYWYPPIAPIRTVVAAGVLLLMLQGVAVLVRNLYLVIRSKPYD